MKKVIISLASSLVSLVIIFTIIFCSFNNKKHNIFIDELTNGVIVADQEKAKKNKEIELTVTPDTGYRLKENTLKYNTTVITGTSFNMPNEDVIIKAEFEAIEYTISISSSITNGSVTANKTKGNMGEEITLTVTPNTGYRLKENTLKFNTTVITGTSFNMPNEDVIIKAEFELYYEVSKTLLQLWNENKDEVLTFTKISYPAITFDDFTVIYEQSAIAGLISSLGIDYDATKVVSLITCSYCSVSSIEFVNREALDEFVAIVRTILSSDGLYYDENYSINQNILYYNGIGDVTIGNYDIIDEKYYISKDRKTFLRYCGDETSFNIPNSVEKISSFAFEETTLTSISIPNSVTYIGYFAFCDSIITSINIGNNITYIGMSAFSSCKDLTSLIMPKSVTYIGKNAFYGTNIALIFIDENIDASSFVVNWDDSCTILRCSINDDNYVESIELCNATTNTNSPCRNGYIFIGWTTTLGSNVKDYDDLSSVPINTKVYAIWQEE